MNIKTKEENNYFLITVLDIRIDSGISEDYKSELIKYLKDKPLVIDLKKLEFIDSSGLSAFIYFYKQAKAKNLPVRLINVSDKMMSIFNMTGLTKIFEIYESLNEAISDLE